jgi:carboxypeptidase C (cathepsin A)
MNTYAKPREGVPRTQALVSLTSLSCHVYTRLLAIHKSALECTHKMSQLTRLAALAATSLLSLTPFLAAAQERTQEKETKTVEKEKPAEPTPPPAKEESSVTEHSIKIGGQTIPYKAIAGTILLKNEKEEPQALIYSTSYIRTDTKDTSQRPISFIYNGGPGSASVWLHMGAFGPRRVVTPNAESTPPPPYKVADNAGTLLDKTDMVFIDPVGTGYSRAVGKAQDKDFWGIDEDVKSLAQFITLYVNRNSRWNSPKFLIGESYGTFRSAALGNYLQQHDGMDFNGIDLISSVLDLGTLSFQPGSDMPYILYLPSYAATAWYHKILKDRPENLAAFIEEARKFAQTEYAPALMKGSRLSAAEKAEMAKKLSRYTGLSEDYLIKADLRVKLGQFMEELQRNRGLTTGRLDSRYTGFTYDLLSEFAESDPQSAAVTGAFTATFNSYVRDELKFVQDRNYHAISEGVGSNWDWKHQTGRGRGFFPGSPNVEGDLAQAILSNPHLQVEVENGYYDMATPFFATEYTMEHLGLPEQLQKNIRLNYYDAGHMMYLRDEELAKLKSNIGAFIDSAAKH